MNRNALIALAALGLTACGTDTSAVTSLTGVAANGEKVYSTTCNGCHGADGRSGSTKLDIVTPIKNDTSDAIATILNGQEEMPAFSSQLSSQQIADVVAYLKTK
jgi:mono/diheme cytochrome c family protein